MFLAKCQYLAEEVLRTGILFACSCQIDDKRTTENSESLGVAAEKDCDEVFVVHVTYLYTCRLKKETGPQDTKSLGKGRSR